MKEHIIDIQNSLDQRNLAIDRVGIRGLRHPILFQDLRPYSAAVLPQSVTGYLEMLVDLPPDRKGTHMSRFIALLNAEPFLLSFETLPVWLRKMVHRLQATAGELQIQFPYFLPKQAPRSQALGLMDYDVCFKGILKNQRLLTLLTLIVPVTSLCPCSKAISEYGAHNQRSHVTITVALKKPLSIASLIQLVESKASSELYSVLKREDEKVITERAYDNPKFVEDMVRDIAHALERLPAIQGYKISSENFESIHNHSAYAEIDKLQEVLASAFSKEASSHFEKAL